MAWWDDLINQSNSILSNVNKTFSINNSKISTFNPNIETSGLKNINTDLTSQISGITDAGRGITQKDYQNFQLNVRPQNPYETSLNTTISGLQDYAGGKSKVGETIANRYLQKFDTSAATSTLNQAQKIASNPYLTPGAKNAALMETQRQIGSQRSELIGGLAQNAQERAYTATTQLTSVLQNAVNWKESEFINSMNVIGNDLNRELQSKIATGELTKDQASLDLQKYQIDLNTIITQKNLELEQLKELDDYSLTASKLGIDTLSLGLQASGIALQKDQLDLTKQQIETEINIKKAELQNSQINMWQTTAANAVLEMKNTNPNITTQDVMNDPYTYQAISNTYQSITGTKDIPSDTWIQTFVNKIKSESQIEQETMRNKIETIVSTLTNDGIDQKTANDVGNWFKMYQETGGLIRTNDDGTVSLLGIDGNPIQTIGESTISNNLTSDQINNLMVSSYSQETTNELINLINDGKLNSSKDIINKLESKYGSLTNIDKTNIEKFYTNVQNGNIKSTITASTANEEITYSGNIWGTQANKILESTNSIDNINKQYIIDERTNDLINDSTLNQKITNKDLYNNILNQSEIWNPQTRTHTGGGSEFTNNFDVGSIINLDDKIYRVMTDPTKTPNDLQHIRLYDFNQGKTVVLSSTPNGQYSFVKE